MLGLNGRNQFENILQSGVNTNIHEQWEIQS